MHDAQAGAERSGEAGQVALRDGCDEGVDHRRGGALVLAVFGQHLVRDVDQGAAVLGQGVAQHALVLGAQEGEETADSDGLRARGPYAGGDLAGRLRRKRLDDRAVGGDAFRRPEAALRGHERRRAADPHVVERWTGLPPDLQNVLEAGGGDQRRLRALAFEHRVRRYRGAVDDDGRVHAADLAQSAEHAFRGVVGRRGRLVNAHPSGVDDVEVGEGAADIDAGDRGVPVGGHGLL